MRANDPLRREAPQLLEALSPLVLAQQADDDDERVEAQFHLEVAPPAPEPIVLGQAAPEHHGISGVFNPARGAVEAAAQCGAVIAVLGQPFRDIIASLAGPDREIG